MIGVKPGSHIVGAVPGAQYVYGIIELAALEPAYVEHGRRRPKPGPLGEAVDGFVEERIREIAPRIDQQRQAKLHEHSLHKVLEENRKLNEFENRFPPSNGDGSGVRETAERGPEEMAGAVGQNGERTRIGGWRSLRGDTALAHTKKIHDTLCHRVPRPFPALARCVF